MAEDLVTNRNLPGKGNPATNPAQARMQRSAKASHWLAISPKKQMCEKLWTLPAPSMRPEIKQSAAWRTFHGALLSDPDAMWEEEAR
jgi:hypothetical protein